MTRTTGIGKRGFTLIELLVVVGMIALITGAVSTSMSSAMQRARIQKATAEVEAVTQAILAYENHSKTHKLPENMTSWTVADSSSMSFLLGAEKASTGSKNIPVLVQAALSSGGVMRDPWGSPYKVMINAGNVNSPKPPSVKTGYYLPNFYRLTEEERK